MVVIKGLSTSKIRVSGEREARKNGRIKSLKVYTEDEKVKIRNEDRVAAETKRKPIPVKGETNHINADIQKEALNKLEKLLGKNINSGRKVLADISNSRGIFQKNDTFSGSRPGKSKMEKVAYSQRASVGTKASNAISSSGKDLKVVNGNPKTRVHGQETAGHVIRASAGMRASMASSSSGKDLKVFIGNQKTRLQGLETVGHVTRKSTGNYFPFQRKSFPILKHVEKVDTCDPKKGNLELKVKNKDTYGFSVKPKVGSTVMPPVSNARDNRWKHRVSEGSIKMVSEGQPVGDAKRLSRISVKPTVRTTVGIPKAKRVSRSISVFTKPTSANPVLSKQKEATSGSSFSKHTESFSREQNLDASTSNITAKGKKSGRRKSYTSLLIERTKLLKDEANVTKEEVLPNIYDDANQLEVAEYVDEIYRHYWVTEAHNPLLKNNMEIQTDITPQMRGILINWLVEVHLKFDLMQETLYLMVTLLDYYLSIVTIKRSEMQLVGLTSLLLASKYEDFWHPKVMELISISAEIYTRDQMLEMETTILTKLNFRLNLPTPYVFMLQFLRAAQAGKKFENLAFFLIELCLVEYDALHFKPSLLCASSIYVARCTLNLTPAWTPLLCKHSHYEEFQIRDCADMILRFHKAARTALLRVTYDKFVSNDKCNVALIKPLDKLPSP